MHDVLIRRAAPEDAEALHRLGRETFVDTFVREFAMGYPPEDLEAFLVEAHDPDFYRRTIADAAQAVWVAEREGRALAYATAGPNGLPHPDGRPEDGELYRLYVAREAQGLGLGRHLLNEALGWLERDGPRRLWIGVWSGNLKAQRLYARYGFDKVGEYEFPVGRVRDREFILSRSPSPLAGEGRGPPRAARWEG